MKKALILTLSALFVGNLWAQPDEPPLREKKEKVDAMKAAFITTELDLSTQEAQEFWPVYNEMDKKIDKIRLSTAAQRRKMRDEGKTPDDLSEAELNKVMEDQFKNEAIILAIKKEYHTEFIKVLGTRKTFELYMAERRFMRELMRKGRGKAPKEREHKKHD